MIASNGSNGKPGNQIQRMVSFKLDLLYLDATWPRLRNNQPNLSKRALKRFKKTACFCLIPKESHHY
jgi:hypothetical protein